MKAKIVEHTQAVERSGEDETPVRTILTRGTSVGTKGTTKIADKEPGKSFVKLAAGTIFELCDAGKAKPETQEDLAIYRRRGRKGQTVAEDDAAA